MLYWYNVSRKFKEIEIADVVDTAKVLLLSRKLGDAYRLLQVIGIHQIWS